jgi:nucleoside-diphosphate-sugar epimerase
MARVVVTGGSGKLGRASVKDLLEHGHEVFNADTVAPKENLCPFVQVNFEDMAETIQVFSSMDWGHYRGVDAVVHLAAVPMPGLLPNETVFRINTTTTYNVFEAARRLGIKNVIWASSETLLGLPFDEPPLISRSMKNTPRGPRPATRFPSSWAKRWPSNSADGIRT